MKKAKILLTSIAMLLGAAAMAQTSNFSIVVQMVPGTCTLGDTVLYQVQIRNDGNFVYPANSLVATISAPGDGKIIGFTSDGATAGWQIITNSQVNANGGGNTVTIRNTIALEGDNVFEPNLYVVAVSLGTQEGNLTSAKIERNLFGGFGAVPDDDPNDNNSGSSLAVQAPTPLNFLSINAAWQNNDGIVKWSVAEEVANNYFSIERSFDGKNFKEVGQVKSMGDHKDAYTYSFTDRNAKFEATDKAYYRVKQIDNSGRFKYTSIVKLLVEGAKDEAYIFPNPIVGDHFNFVYQNNNVKDAELDIRIMDVQGRLVRSIKAPITSGKNQIEISTEGMAAAMYHLSYTNELNNIKGTLRVVKD